MHKEHDITGGSWREKEEEGGGRRRKEEEGGGRRRTRITSETIKLVQRTCKQGFLRITRKVHITRAALNHAPPRRVPVIPNRNEDRSTREPTHGGW